MSPQSDLPDDYPVPETRPADRDALLDALHDTMRRLNAAYFAVVGSERSYETHRSQVVEHYIADGESIRNAQDRARHDPECLRLHHRLVDARANLARLEAFAAHWRFLIEHLPST